MEKYYFICTSSGQELIASQISKDSSCSCLHTFASFCLSGSISLFSASSLPSLTPRPAGLQYRVLPSSHSMAVMCTRISVSFWI